MLALARPSVNEVWPLAVNQNHRFNRPANDNNITSGLCTRTKFTHDASDRLLTGNGTIAGNHSYSLDKLDNALNFAGVTGTYNGLNQIGTFNAVSYTYDANGNLSSDGTRTYTFDAADRLKTVTQGATTVTFAYDGMGRRLKQTVGATETRYIWCGAAICQQRNSSDTAEKRFYSEGEYVHTGTKKYLTLTDHLGSVRDVIDITGTPTLVGSFDYRPYGAVARSWGTVTTGYTYAGLFAQTNTGLLLSTTRAYNPANGKWLNFDPIREAGGINLTGYVGAGPMSAIDPEGNYLLIVGVVVGGLAILNWGRNWLNYEPPTVGIARGKGWIVMRPELSVFHMQGPGNQHNIKMISPDGHYEAVYDPCEWLTTDPKNRGTYNYFDPRFWGGIPHGIFDIGLYFVFGSTPGEMLDPGRFVTLINWAWGEWKKFLLTLPASPGYGDGGGSFLGGGTVLQPQPN